MAQANASQQPNILILRRSHQLVEYELQQPGTLTAIFFFEQRRRR